MKVSRMRKEKDFEDALKNGVKLQGEIFSLYARAGAGCEGAAAGVSISKRHAPRATRRNYVKRVIKTALQDESCPLRENTRVMIRLARNIKDIKKRTLSRTIRDDLAKLLEKAGKIT